MTVDSHSDRVLVANHSIRLSTMLVYRSSGQRSAGCIAWLDARRDGSIRRQRRKEVEHDSLPALWLHLWLQSLLLLRKSIDLKLSGRRRAALVAPIWSCVPRLTDWSMAQRLTGFAHGVVEQHVSG